MAAQRRSTTAKPNPVARPNPLSCHGGTKAATNPGRSGGENAIPVRAATPKTAIAATLTQAGMTILLSPKDGIQV